jgi:hypothetical protein
MANGFIPYMQFQAPRIQKEKKGGGFLGKALGVVGGIAGTAIPGVGNVVGAAIGSTLGGALGGAIEGEGVVSGAATGLMTGPIQEAMGERARQQVQMESIQDVEVPPVASIDEEDEISAAIAAALGVEPGPYLANTGMGYRF